MNMIPALVQKTMSCLLIVKVSSLILRNIEYIENTFCLGDRVGKAYRGLASMTRKHKLCRDWNELATWRLQYPHAGLNGAYCRFVFYSLDYRV